MKTIAERITLTPDAKEIVANLRKSGSFRSDSETIEECIRRIYLILQNPAAVEIHLERFRRTLVTEGVCFSKNCWWTSTLIRCRNCPYVDSQGNILDDRVGGKHD